MKSLRRSPDWSGSIAISFNFLYYLHMLLRSLKGLLSETGSISNTQLHSDHTVCMEFVKLWAKHF